MAIGATDISVTLALPEPARAGEEFVVQWSGPAGQDDRIDVALAGEQDLYAGISAFAVNDTIEEGDRPEGAGVLVAPTEPRRYELRYILGRSPDMRVIHRLPLVLGQTGFCSMARRLLVTCRALCR